MAWAALLSIPFIGIFALHLATKEILKKVRVNTFNSLYWDFCFASGLVDAQALSAKIAFQFPLLGFLLCIVEFEPAQAGEKPLFQFPLLGFLLCICRRALFLAPLESLSIPFIGIFALHPYASTRSVYGGAGLSIPFIGIFALHRKSNAQCRLLD